MENCDENGVCQPAPLAGDQAKERQAENKYEVIYIGDPMCSWCWGISRHLNQLQDFLMEQGIGYNIILGGLRPGGGDPWNEEMKNFLRHHWEQVTSRSGQPFGYDLFSRSSFNYDTEPACRAVVTSKHFLDTRGVSAFFEEVQRKFYVDNEDPGEVDFYQSICEKFSIDFDHFKRYFLSAEVGRATHEEFVMNREWGISGYPTLVLRQGQQLYLIANGYAEYELMVERIEQTIDKLEKELSVSS